MVREGNWWTRESEGNIRERAGRIVGKAKGYSGWNLLIRIIGKILAFILFLIFVGLIILFGIFLYNSFTGGGAGVVGTELESGLEETGAGRGAKGFFKDIFEVIINPEKAVARAGTFETTVRENKENEELGVFLEDLTFNIKNKVFEEGRGIVGRARLKSDSLLDTTTVRISCDIEDYDKTKPILTVTGTGVTSAFTAVSGRQTLEEVAQENFETIQVYKGRPSINNILCNYKEGIKLEDLKEAFFESEDRNLAALKFNIRARYDFETNAFSKVYYMSNQALQDIFLEGEDPFKKFNIKDSLIQRDGTIKTENTAGPIDFVIASPDAQPFAEGNPYFLEIGIRSAGSKWKGDLRRLNSLEVHVPSEIIIEEENCDLERSNNVYGDQVGLFTIYNLKEENIKKINDICASTREADRVTGKIISDTCLDKVEDIPNFLCQFTMQDNQNTEPEFTYFRGNAEYEFETRITDVIKILKTGV